jgi:DNA-binding SARP family transcriptional activator
MEKLSIRLLGWLRVSDRAGNDVTVPGKKPQTSLAFLVLNADQPQSRDKLATLLWGDRFEEQARLSLHQCISKLRKTLGDGEPRVLLMDGNHVALNLDAGGVIDRFDATAHIGVVTVRDGSVYFNGQLVSPSERERLAAACRGR